MVGFKVTVIGAAGGIGQPLSLLLKQNPHISDLALFDVVPAMEGIAADIAHINTNATITAHWPEDMSAPAAATEAALKGTHLVVIPAGFPRKPGMTRADLFDKNAGILKGLCESIAKTAPNAMVCIITNPVNSMVPLVSEMLKKLGAYDPKRVFGISHLDVVRANTFIAEKLSLNASDVSVTVIGGHSGITILPIFSTITVNGKAVNLTDGSSTQYKLNQNEVETLIKDTQEAGTVIVEKKKSAGSATLSMAYAGYEFVHALLRGMAGEKNVVMNTFIKTDKVAGCDYFAIPVELGPSGVEKQLNLPVMSEYEIKYIEDQVKPTLIKDIQIATEFVSKL